MKPVLTIPGTNYVVCFCASAETISPRQHFIEECGWSAKDFNRIKGFDWFSAEVSLHLGGKELGTEYLGCCCYESAEEFWSVYASDYFADMVFELVYQHAPGVLPIVSAWRQTLRGAA
jgi:hypothetical protein